MSRDSRALGRYGTKWRNHLGSKTTPLSGGREGGTERPRCLSDFEWAVAKAKALSQGGDWRSSRAKERDNAKLAGLRISKMPPRYRRTRSAPLSFCKGSSLLRPKQRNETYTIDSMKPSRWRIHSKRCSGSLRSHLAWNSRIPKTSTWNESVTVSPWNAQEQGGAFLVYFYVDAHSPPGKYRSPYQMTLRKTGLHIALFILAIS